MTSGLSRLALVIGACLLLAHASVHVQFWELGMSYAWFMYDLHCSFRCKSGMHISISGPILTNASNARAACVQQSQTSIDVQLRFQHVFNNEPCSYTATIRCANAVVLETSNLLQVHA